MQQNIAASKPSLVVRICDAITKFSLYLLVVLLPVFFLPWSSDALDFNKQTLLALLAFIALFAWMLKILISGNFHFNVNKVHIVVGLLLLVYIISSVFSVMQYGSLWGWPNSTSESLLSVIGLFIVYFLISNTFAKKEVFVSLILLAFSSLAAASFALLQIFGVYTLPFSFSHSVAFNTIGQVGALGLFLAVLLPIFMVMLITSKRWWKILFALNILAIFTTLLLTNYKFIWWIVLIGSALIMILGTIKRTLFNGRWMFLPMFFLIIALFFIILSPQIRFSPQLPGEVYISLPSNWHIDQGALKDFSLLGSGPGTFGYDFAKYKDSDFNNGQLWNVSFNVGYSKIVTNLATTGVLGALAFLAVLLATLFYGIRYLMIDNPQADKEETFLILGVLAGFAIETVGFCLYNSNLSLDFIYFLFMAMLVALIFKNNKTYTLEPSSLLTLIVTFAFTLVFIFGLGFLILDGQRYVADLDYAAGLTLLQQNNLNGGLAKLEEAASMNSGLDLYFNQLSQIYLLQVQTELQNTKDSQDEKTKVLQADVANALNAATIATNLGPKNVSNWSVRGNVYQNLIGLVTDANTWAVTSYTSAIALDPVDPYLLLQRGEVYYQNKDYKDAQTDLENAIALKPDYPDVLYFLGLTYDAQNQTAQAIDAFTKLLAMLPADQASGVQQILNNLKAGQPALAGLGGSQQAAPTPSSTTNAPSAESSSPSSVPATTGAATPVAPATTTPAKKKTTTTKKSTTTAPASTTP